MKKLMGITAVLGVAMLAFAAFAPAASAQTPPPGDAAGNAFVAGRGVLVAHGAGVAAVKGAMDLHATAAEGGGGRRRIVCRAPPRKLSPAVDRCLDHHPDRHPGRFQRFGLLQPGVPQTYRAIPAGLP